MPSGVWPGVSMIPSRTSPNSTASPSCMRTQANSAAARPPRWIVAPALSRHSMWPATTSAWKCVRNTCLMVYPPAAASARYWSTSRWGSTTAAVFVFSSVIMYDACERQAR